MEQPQGNQLERIQEILEDHPVQLAILFGSHARNEASPDSDIDLAVMFEESTSAESGDLDTFLALSAELSTTLERDDIDVVDLRAIDPSFASQILTEGILLAGSTKTRRELVTEVRRQLEDRPGPAERFDRALERIDEHLA